MSIGDTSIEGRLARLEAQMVEDRKMIYGHWEQTPDGPMRVPGMLEQIRDQAKIATDTLEEVKKRDAEWAKIGKFFSRLGWIAVTPIIACIGVAMFILVIHWLDSLSPVSNFMRQ